MIKSKDKLLAMKITIELTESDNVQAHIRANELVTFIRNYQIYLRNRVKNDIELTDIESAYNHFNAELVDHELINIIEY